MSGLRLLLIERCAGGSFQFDVRSGEICNIPQLFVHVGKYRSHLPSSLLSSPRLQVLVVDRKVTELLRILLQLLSEVLFFLQLNSGATVFTRDRLS